jgi:hypothetical protein
VVGVGCVCFVSPPGGKSIEVLGASPWRWARCKPMGGVKVHSA